MKSLIISIILLLNSTLLFSQGICRTDILNEEKLKEENKIEEYLQYDFSALWATKDNPVGIIGDSYQRIYIKVLTVVKNEFVPNEYLVYGKSRVKNNICDFVGKITIDKIQETIRVGFGADDMYKGESKTQGLITARYDFFENKAQKHTGIFSGTLKTKWYLDKNGKMQYDNMNDHSDGYFNNAYVGLWQGYGTEQGKICNWANHRVPNVKCGFDTGAGEFFPAEEYAKSGWDNYLKAYLNGDKKAILEEEKEWWK